MRERRPEFPEHGRTIKIEIECDDSYDEQITARWAERMVR